ncbi:DNA repair and recombination protein radA [Striga asiatica]|uniref:DNA repair and recombination protein radA n=1 Tax=Striga asiatica TaxID=4170 RepID=A0A5A7PET9_STRAF|nr:DNA repair and recombination protein radA [Striga asiatica]
MEIARLMILLDYECLKENGKRKVIISFFSEKDLEAQTAWDILHEENLLYASPLLARIWMKSFRACAVFQAKVVIIDNIIFHFRQDFDVAHRTRVLSCIALKLMKLAKKFNLAVRTFKLRNSEDPKKRVYELLTCSKHAKHYSTGDSLAHASTNRVILYQKW